MIISDGISWSLLEYIREVDASVAVVGQLSSVAVSEKCMVVSVAKQEEFRSRSGWMF